jgi:hypothetical protein
MGDVNADLAAVGVRLVDDAYLAWFSAEGEAEGALRAWRDAGSSAVAMSYARYRAALDREEAAARDLERLWTLAEPCRVSLGLGQIGG